MYSFPSVVRLRAPKIQTLPESKPASRSYSRPALGDVSELPFTQCLSEIKAQMSIAPRPLASYYNRYGWCRDFQGGKAVC